jgi:transcriptional regulator of acetoin/glycerol metabolism
VEAADLLSVLEKHDWNRAAAARELGIHRTTLYRKIRSLGLPPPKPRKRQ